MTTDELHALHRYYLAAQFLRERFEERLNAGTTAERMALFTAMQLWYASLYVVIEGWVTLRGRDEALTLLLRSKHKERLNQFRNATYHFDSNWDRWELFMHGTGDSADVAIWVAETHDALGAALSRALDSESDSA